MNKNKIIELCCDSLKNLMLHNVLLKKYNDNIVIKLQIHGMKVYLGRNNIGASKI